MRQVTAAAVLTLIFGSLSLSAAAGQVSSLPPRDRPPASRSGAAAFKGRVVDGATGLAIARARVRLMGPGGQRDPVVTDDAGAFAFSSLPPGQYSLIAERSGYLTGRYPEGGQTMRTGSRPVTLSDAQVLGGVTIQLFRGGVIAGRVIDQNGDPIESASVSVMRLPRSGRGRPQTRMSSTTNDIGEFRAAHLEPGRYLVLVTPHIDPVGQADGLDQRPVPTFYPGVLTADQAQPLTIQRGESVTGVDITPVAAFQARVSGRVVDSSGDPVPRNANLMLTPILRDLTNFSSTTGIAVRPDGTFQFVVPPGEYDLRARAAPMVIGGPPSPGTERVGSVRLAVNGDVTDVVITLSSPGRVTGRLIFDGISPVPPLTGMQSVFFTNNDNTQTCQSGRSELAADGTFVAEGLSGTCIARAAAGIGQWMVRAIVHDGKDLLDQPITFEPGQQLRDVQVILTDRPTELAIRVADEQGGPTREYVALVFSVQKARWGDTSRYVRPYVPPVPITQPAMQGLPIGSAAAGSVSTMGIGAAPVAPAAGARPQGDAVRGLPAGEYYAVAVDDIDSESFRDPDFLERLSRGATRITIGEEGRSEVNLRRVKLADVLREP